MKNFILLILLGSLAFASKSQSLDRTVIGSAGGVDVAGDISLEWTLGEFSAGSSTNNNGFYTMGFHQPLLQIKLLPFTTAHTDYRINIAPNPVLSVLNVTWLSESDAMIYLRLSEVQGKTLLTKSANGRSGSLLLQMSNIPSGVYLLEVRNSKGLLIHTFQVVKAQ